MPVTVSPDLWACAAASARMTAVEIIALCSTVTWAIAMQDGEYRVDAKTDVVTAANYLFNVFEVSE